MEIFRLSELIKDSHNQLQTSGGDRMKLLNPAKGWAGNKQISWLELNIQFSIPRLTQCQSELAI
jgi:hypothetical protein